VEVYGDCESIVLYFCNQLRAMCLPSTVQFSSVRRLRYNPIFESFDEKQRP
jgi:hypothetical protein